MMNPLNWGDNENPIVRFVRIVAFAAAAAAVTAAIQQLPMVDWPGEYDGIIVSLGTAALAAIDKLLRSQA